MQLQTVTIKLHAAFSKIIIQSESLMRTNYTLFACYYLQQQKLHTVDLYFDQWMQKVIPVWIIPSHCHTASEFLRKECVGHLCKQKSTTMFIFKCLAVGEWKKTLQRFFVSFPVIEFVYGRIFLSFQILANRWANLPLWCQLCEQFK